MLETLRKMVLTDTVRVALGLPPVAGGVMDETLDAEADDDRRRDSLRQPLLDVIHSHDGSVL